MHAFLTMTKRPHFVNNHSILFGKFSIALLSYKVNKSKNKASPWTPLGKPFAFTLLYP